LQLRSEGPVAWVRSNTFQPPATGRLSVWFWLRVDDEERQPPLQLAMEGRLNGQTYYRSAKVGADATPLTTGWAPYLVRIDDLPATGLSDLRVAIDLMGQGEVWVDDVLVFDLWLDKTERHELLKKIALANLYLGKGEVAECERLLRGYWPELLRRFLVVEEPQVAAAPEARRPSPDSEASPGGGQAEPETPRTSWLKKLTPKLPTWFR
jgi:hypothetical protein